MSIAEFTLDPPSGFRRMNLVMLANRDRADRFEGQPKGTAKPLTFLMAFQEAEPYLGLPTQAFKLVSWLVKQTMAHDWEEGSRPIAWPSARLQQEFLGLSAARVKALNRTLFEMGIFVLRDNPQGKRWGRRGPDKRIVEAYGFDLSPLAIRFDEFVRLAADAKTERARMKHLRGRVTIARRAVRQAGEMLEILGTMPAAWSQLADETAALVIAAKHCDRSDHLDFAARRLEALKTEAEQWVKQSSNSVETDPEGPVNKPHTTSTNLTPYLKDTVMGAEESSAAEGVAPQRTSSFKRHGRAGDQEAPPSTGIKLSVDELVVLVPRFSRYVPARNPSWRDAIDAAGGPVRHELGISQSLWAEACGILGRDAATLAMAVVAAKDQRHFTASAGGYFAGMVRKAEKGELFLEKSIWGLRQAKYGAPAGRAH